MLDPLPTQGHNSNMKEGAEKDEMASNGNEARVVADASSSTVDVSTRRGPIGSVIDIRLTLCGGQEQPIVDPEVMKSVEGFVTEPSGRTACINFPNQPDNGGVCTTTIYLWDVGVHKIHVKITDVDIRHSPVTVCATVRGNLLGTYKPSSLSQPHDIIMRNNIIAVTGKGSNYVQVFDQQFQPTGKFCPLEDEDMNKFDPYAIAWTGKSFVVTDLANHRVVEFDKDFAPVRVFGRETLSRPTGIAAGKNGKRLYVADAEQHCIFVFDEDRHYMTIIGERGTALGQLDTPWFMDVNSMGHLVVADLKNHRVQVFDPKTNGPLRIIDVKYNQKTWDCRGLGLDHNDNIYVSARYGIMRGWSDETVLVYSPTGDFLGNFGSRFNYVRGLTVTKQRESTIVYVVDGAHHAVLAYEM